MSLEPESDQQLRAHERELGDRLTASRPAPRARFRGALGRHLELSDPGYGPRPESLRWRVAGYLTLGLLLIALGAALGAGAL
jgi:hypothetical protein